jgi:hypothetical protein
LSGFFVNFSSQLTCVFKSLTSGEANLTFNFRGFVLQIPLLILTNVCTAMHSCSLLMGLNTTPPTISFPSHYRCTSHNTDLQNLIQIISLLLRCRCTSPLHRSDCRRRCHKDQSRSTRPPHYTCPILSAGCRRHTSPVQYKFD